MDLRDRLTAATKDAMKAKDNARLSTLRLISAAIKDREIAARGDDEQGLKEGDLIAILSRMVKQSQESARAYEEGGRLELAQKEENEIKVIQEFLPRQLSDTEVSEAIEATIRELGAESVRDMGRVMEQLRKKYAGQLDFAVAGALVKKRLIG